MFDDEFAPATAHPAAPEAAPSNGDPARAGSAPAGPSGESAWSSGVSAWSSAELTALVDQLAAVELDAPDAERVDQLTALERIKAACAAAQVRITDRFIDSQGELARQWHEQAQACSDASDFDGWCTAREQARRHEFMPPTRDHPTGTTDGQGAGGHGGDGRSRGSRGTRRAANPSTGVAAQVALARRESPAKGTRLVRHALALARHLPHTLAALTTGLLNEHRAGLVARLTSHLSPELQRALDAQVIGANGQHVGTWGDRELERHVRACADRLDAAGAAERARVAESERRVTIRPVPDTMALLTAVLPVAQAVAVHAALARAAATAKAGGDPRTKDQIMADTLVALVTGQQTASDVPVEIQVIITDRALFDGDDTPAHIPGYGPVPAAWVRHLLTPDPDETDDAEHETDNSDLADTDLDTDQGDLEGAPDTNDPDLHLPDLGFEETSGQDAERHETAADQTDSTRQDDTDEDVADSADGHGHRAPAVGPDPDQPPHPAHPPQAHCDPPADAGPAPPEPSPQRPPPPFTPPVPPPRPFRRAQTWLRRLFTHPATGTLVAMDSRRRVFDDGLRRFLITRDGTCRTPWCDAPIRHLDHIRRWADGGPTTAANGEGLCVRCNLTHEEPGFHLRVIHPGPTSSDHSATDGSATERSATEGHRAAADDPGTPHTVELTTPTGHTYTSTAPPVLPGLGRPATARPAPATPHPAATPRDFLTELAPTDLSPLERHLRQLLAG